MLLKIRGNGTAIGNPMLVGTLGAQNTFPSAIFFLILFKYNWKKVINVKTNVYCSS